jgi:hypothetical protein
VEGLNFAQGVSTLRKPTPRPGLEKFTQNSHHWHSPFLICMEIMCLGLFNVPVSVGRFRLASSFPSTVMADCLYKSGLVWTL